ncbi:MAG: hypothetical protein IT577_16895 [Verrucomicrobiae bacterium]|nr:hypothetical protein [Verrucomicrobiae bacterium]
MSKDKRRLLTTLLETVLGFFLWFWALRLLGVEMLTPPTIGGLAGSLLVLFGFFALANHILRFLRRADASRGEPDLYTQVQAEIAAERRMQKVLEERASANGPSPHDSARIERPHGARE